MVGSGVATVTRSRITPEELMNVRYTDSELSDAAGSLGCARCRLDSGEEVFIPPDVARRYNQEQLEVGKSPLEASESFRNWVVNSDMAVLAQGISASLDMIYREPNATGCRILYKYLRTAYDSVRGRLLQV
jgi:hypothetical protein